MGDSSQVLGPHDAGRGSQGPVHECAVCKTTNQRKRLKQCSNCNLWSHLTCVNLTRAQATCLPIWHCRQCISHPLSDQPAVSDGGALPQRSPPSDWAESLAHLKGSVPLIQRLPKSVRGPLADRLATTIEQILQDSSTSSWWNLFSFTFNFLRSPDKQAPNHLSNAAAIRHSLNAVESSSFISPLFDNSDFHHHSSDLGRRIVGKCSDGDTWAALQLLTSDDAVAEYNQDTISALQSKHPPGPTSPNLPDPPSTSASVALTADTDTVRQAISSMRPGGGAGPDGMRPIYLQQMISPDTAEQGRRLLSALTSLINLALKGAIPDFARDAFYGASLIALNKKTGGIRPIAIGSIYRRLASKICARFATGQLASQLEPTQLGVGTEGGTEAAVHAAREFVHSPDHASINQINILTKIDIKNAFNSIHRSAFLTCVREKCPQIYPLLYQAYSSTNPLYYRTTKIESRSGLHQGDPLASLSFALTINEAVSRISCPFNLWYLDDGTLGGELELVLQNLSLIQREFSAMGLELNHSKCEVTVLGSPSLAAHQHALLRAGEVVPNISETPLDNLSLLGAALGPSSLHSSVSRFIEKVSGPTILFLARPSARGSGSSTLTGLSFS